MCGVVAIRDPCEQVARYVRPTQASVSTVRPLGIGTRNHRGDTLDGDRLRPNSCTRYSRRRSDGKTRRKGAQIGSPAHLGVGRDSSNGRPRAKNLRDLRNVIDDAQQAVDLVARGL
jgi:hypothetical protein